MPRFVFLGAMGRSGTNLLRNMLDCHSAVASGPEFNHLEDIIKTYRAMFRSVHAGRISAYLSLSELAGLTAKYVQDVLGGYARNREKPILVEKTPSNLWIFPELAELFPDAKFIHLIRDGRDVALSHREVGKRLAARGLPMHPRREAALVNMFHCGALWSETIKFAQSLTFHGTTLLDPARILTVRYEELVGYPESVMKRVCKHIGIDYEEDMLRPECRAHDTHVDGAWVTETDIARPVSSDSIGRWRTSLSLKERVLFSGAGQEGLRLAGYENDALWVLHDLSQSPSDAKAEIAEAEALIEQYSLVSQQHGTLAYESL